MILQWQVDRPRSATVDELIDIRIAAFIQLFNLAAPDDFALENHGDMIRDFAR